jgi:hypothetical protein
LKNKILVQKPFFFFKGKKKEHRKPRFSTLGKDKVSFQETYLLTYRALNPPTGAGSTLGVVPCKIQGAEDTFPYANYVLPLSMKILSFGMVLAMDNVLLGV